jgi:plastocyanin
MMATERTRPGVAWLLLFLTAACGEKTSSPPPTSTPAHASPSASAPTAAAYEAVDVQGGGSIEGDVRLSGKAPRLAPRPITKDHATCGAKAKPSEAVLVGPGGALANVVVTIEGIRRGKKLPAAAASPVLDQRACDYKPHVQAVAVGSTIAILNSDDILHNIHGYLNGRETLFNIGQPVKGQRNEKKLEREGVVNLQCDAGHTWMQAYIVVVGHPYFATTGSDGRFSLADVPAGSYKLKAWHEKLGTTESDVKVEPGAAARATFEYR